VDVGGACDWGWVGEGFPLWGGALVVFVSVAVVCPF